MATSWQIVSRLRLTKPLTTLAAALLLGSVGVSHGQEQHELKASVFTPASNPLARAMDEWAALVKEKSGGRLSIKVFPGAQMGPPPRQFDLARSGVADIAIVLHGLTPGRFPLTELAHLPGVMGADYPSSLALSEVWSKLEKSDHPGTKVIAMQALTPVPVISRSAVSSAADLKGKRLRAAGSVQSDVLEAFGAVPTLVQPGDMNDALSKGMIEAASVGYSGIASYHLTDAGKFIAEGDFGGITFAVVLNEKSYGKLPPDLKAVIDETALEARKIFARYLADDEDAIRKKYVESGIKLTKLPADKSLTEAAEKIRSRAVARAKAAGFDAEATLTSIQDGVKKFSAAK
jgi:TRAP-type transport system periplasmic protein